MNIIRSALGHYETIGNPDDADCVIGHSFGTLTGEGSANRALAHFILDNAAGRPVVADHMLVNSFLHGDDTVSYVIDGPIVNYVGQGVGSWGTLVGAKAFMEQEGLNSALMVAQKHHIGRVMMQAKKLNMLTIAAPNLPGHFDPDSDQIWTRSLAMWLPREIIGSLVLRAQHKL